MNIEDNKEVAIRRLMQKDLAPREKYNSAMQEYFTSGVAEQVMSEESEHVKYYMPTSSSY